MPIGGAPHRLTTEPGNQNVPNWSRDGRWIYFSANQGTGRDIWPTPSSGGPAERMTRGASGQFACESPDGRSLLFQPEDADSPLLAIPLTGGDARQLVACHFKRLWRRSARRLLVPCDPTPNPVVHVLDPETGKAPALGETRKPLGVLGSRRFSGRKDDLLFATREPQRRSHVDRELQVSRVFT